jgi:hypothetical protein
MGGFVGLERLRDDPARHGPGDLSPGRRPSGGRRTWRRSALGVLVAATLAAWLPFSYLYLGSAPPPAPTLAVASSSGHPVVTTRTSTGQIIRSPAAVSQGTTGATLVAATPVATRAS